jgi:uncharacterized phage-associated protein
MSAMKLQKLVYYGQAWSLVWDETPLFPERIEAWANGPVVPDLYRSHRGQFTVVGLPTGDPNRLTPEERATMDAVLKFYGPLSGQQLSELTHRDTPWLDAREGLGSTERGSARISDAALNEFYGALTETDV